MTLAALPARSAVILAGLFLATAPAAAQGTAEERSACMGDAFRFCATDIPDVPKIEACLERNQDRLTRACQAEFQPAAVHKTKLRVENFRER